MLFRVLWTGCPHWYPVALYSHSLCLHFMHIAHVYLCSYCLLCDVENDTTDSFNHNTKAGMHWMDFLFTGSSSFMLSTLWSVQFVQPSNDVDEKFYSKTFNSQMKFNFTVVHLPLPSSLLLVCVSKISSSYFVSFSSFLSTFLLPSVSRSTFPCISHAKKERKNRIADEMVNVLQTIDGQNNWAVNVWIVQWFSCTMCMCTSPFFQLHLYSSVQIER